MIINNYLKSVIFSIRVYFYYSHVWGLWRLAGKNSGVVINNVTQVRVQAARAGILWYSRIAVRVFLYVNARKLACRAAHGFWQVEFSNASLGASH